MLTTSHEAGPRYGARFGRDLPRVVVLKVVLTRRIRIPNAIFPR